MRRSFRGNLSRPVPRGFTLLEVLITIALLMGLVSAMFAFGFDMLASRRQALESAWRQRAAATLIDRLESDLPACVASLRGEPGVRGDETSIALLTRGVAASLAERSADDADVFGDLQRAEYRFNSATGHIQARRMPWGSALVRNADFASMGGSVGRVRFRYHDGSQWQDSFDSGAASHLPQAVEVAIWFSAGETSAVDATASETQPQGFDERAFAMRADRGEFSETPPDRLRIIAIPDAGAASVRVDSP